MVVLSIFRTCEDRHIHDNIHCLAVPSYRRMMDNSRCNSHILDGCDSGI